MTSGSSSPGAAAVLVLTRDDDLLAQLQRLAAAAGAPLDVVADPAEARTAWPGAPVVLVGPDALSLLAETSPTRRNGVHVVSLAEAPEGLFRTALALGVETVLELPAAEAWLVDTLADSADGPVRGGSVVGVVGGCGGAGATTFATALAAAAVHGLAGVAEGRPVTLVDADPLGPGIEHLAGLDGAGYDGAGYDGARWARLLESTGRLGSRSLLTSLPRRGALAVLAWGPGPRAALRPDVVREVVRAARRGSALVVVDLPRYPDAATEELLHSCHDVVLVTTLSLPAVAAAAQVAAQLLPHVPRAHLVARGPVSALDPEDVAAALGVPLAAAMPDQRRLDESVEAGLLLRARRGPLARAARATLEVLG